MKASDYIARFLEVQGVTHIFEMSGGMITHMLDSLHQLTGIGIVSMHHEQSASFAADAFARVTGVPGVAMATSGPGATNLLTGIASCYFDTVPGVFITGQVNTFEQKGDRGIRQLGFQETDIASMARPVCKACYEVKDALELPQVLEEAFRVALGGRPGPVLIDIPMNVQRGDVPEPVNGFQRVVREGVASELTPATLDDLAQALAAARKPLILVGRGVRAAGQVEAFRQFVQLVQVPVVASLLGLDAQAYDDPYRVGYIGAYGNRWANMALGDSDFLLVLGARLDIRQTGADTKYFKEGRTIYHVDCDPSEINNRVTGCHALVADLADFFALANQYYAPADFEGRSEWQAEISNLRTQWPDTGEQPGIVGINPNEFMHALSRPGQSAVGYLADVGNHQQWAAQSLELTADQVFLTSGGLGSMGYALPAALGMCFAAGRRPVVTISGDGGFQMNMQELQTIAHHKLPIKLVVLNNNCLGMIRQFQDSYFEGRYQSTYWGYSAPDFIKIAEAYGIPSLSVSDPAQLDEAAAWLWQDPQQPALLQVMVDTHVNCYPKLAFGRPITEMEPFAKPLEMEGT